MLVGVHDRVRAEQVAAILREFANRIERGEVMYVAMTLVHTLAAAKKHGFVAADLHERLETLGLGEYFLTLGVLRDFYLKAEAVLINGDDDDPIGVAPVGEVSP